MRYSFQIAHVRSLRIDLFVAALARAVPPAEPNVEDKKRSRPGSSYSLVAKGNELAGSALATRPRPATLLFCCSGYLWSSGVAGAPACHRAMGWLSAVSPLGMQYAHAIQARLLAVSSLRLGRLWVSFTVLSSFSGLSSVTSDEGRGTRDERFASAIFARCLLY
eukprot:scaffold5181_cov125-Isochrysis_galbana.AAC.1